MNISKLPVLLLCGMSLVNATDNFDIRANYEKHEYRIQMRDGVHLFTVVYSPKDTSAKYPILLTRTPYSVRPYGPEAYPNQLGPGRRFAPDGFIFVYQDVRGRFMSEGDWVEMRPEKDVLNGPLDTDESTDTYDTIDWLIKNIPNNNGKVGLLGISYPGFYTSAGLIRSHPALVAASPQAPVSDLYMGDDAFHNGAFFLLANFSFYTEFNKQNNPTLLVPEKPFPYGTNNGYEFYLGMGPISNANEKDFKYTNPYWTDMLQHPDYDEFWRARNILPHLKDVRPAVLVVGGWFDAEDLSGTLKTYMAIRTQSPQTSLRLVMGPWAHGDWARRTSEKLGELDFGSDTAQFFQNKLELPFFLHYLKGAPDPNLPTVYVFETGRNEWKRNDNWPPEGVRPSRLYLHRGGSLTFDPPAESSGFDEYVSNPENPVPFFNKPTLEMDPTYMNADQRFVEKRPDVLSYRTEPLSQDATIAGPVLASLTVSTTGTDSDFVVKLIDAYPENEGGPLSGYEQLVRGEPFRGKFRHSFEHPEPFVPGKVEQIHFSMPDIYHSFRRGHRILVQIQSSWFPLVDRNPQIFTDIPNAKPSDFVRATERIYRSAELPSFVGVEVER